MTKDEILALGGEVVAALWPDWWKPGRTIVGTDCPHCLEFGIPPTRETSPPDLTEPANFLRALKLIQEMRPHLHYEVRNIGTLAAELTLQWSCEIGDLADASADTPELALLLALVDYVRRGKEQR